MSDLTNRLHDASPADPISDEEVDRLVNLPELTPEAQIRCDNLELPTILGTPQQQVKRANNVAMRHFREARRLRKSFANAMKLLVEIRRAASGRYLSPDLLGRVRLMIEEHDGMISVEEVDADLKLPEGFGDERKSERDPPSIEEQEETITWQGKLIASLLRSEGKLKSELLNANLLNATKYTSNCEMERLKSRVIDLELKNEGKQDITESLGEQCNDKDDTINSLIDQRDEARQENAKLRERVAELEAFIDSPEDVLTRKEGGDDER